MPSRTLPGLELEGFAPYQENNWNDWMDPNLLKLSVLVQLSVQSRTTPLPGAPSEGDKYIVPSGDTNGNAVAVFDDGEWVYYPPKAGTLAWIEDAEAWRYWDGTAWVLLSAGGGGGIEEAPNDGDYYARRNEVWEAFTPGGGGGSTTFTENAQTGTTYTLVLADAPDIVVSLANAGAITLTVPANADAAIPVGSTVSVWQKGAGQVSVVGDTGVTILTPTTATASLKEQGSWASLLKVDTNTWALVGDLEPTPGGTVAAEEVSYDNGTSGLTADDVQAAIDELQAGLALRVLKAGDDMTGPLEIELADASNPGLTVEYPSVTASLVAALFRATGQTAANGVFFVVSSLKASPAANDAIGGFQARGYDTALVEQIYANLTFTKASATSGSHSGRMNVNLRVSGSPQDVFRVDGLNGLQAFGANVFLDPSRLFIPRVFTVGTLPSSPATGARAQVSDANSTTFNATAVGGGSNNVPVFYNGSSWRIG